MNSVDNERFGHFQLGAHLLYPDFSEELVTRHLQLHLPCPDGNQFGNGIKKVFGPNGLVGSSNFLYL